MAEEEKNIRKVGFTVDAGLIQRLGYELVGRAETAVSELIKNAYDADATIVDVDFINSNQKGGTLIISDNGVGMTEDQLVNGFMRISSAEKIHHPISERFNRTKAGRKGIGRFATQRLGEQLTIVTQTKEIDKALKIVIDWNRYVTDEELGSITFPIEEIEKEKEEGTTLTIDILRDGWTYAAIKRVYRYVVDLFQPDYLSDRSRKYNSAIQKEESFKANFNQNIDGQIYPILNERVSIFDKSLATFEGYIDNEHNGILAVKSDSLGLDDIIEIDYSKEDKTYSELKDVYFKIHYFIYNRPEYYKGKITNQDLNGIQQASTNASGVRLYRNGFRVLPYGESTDDWTRVDRRWASESGFVSVPLNNKNLFGFVEITDPNGNTFEETASREGLIENEAFRQLSDFVHKSLIAARQRISEGITNFKEEESNEDDFVQITIEKELSTKEKLQALKNIFDDDSDDANQEEPNEESQEKREKREKQKEEGKRIVEEIRKELEEASMLRVLAGLGLSIGEFTHEIKQFQPAVYGHISKLQKQNLSDEGQTELNGLEKNFDSLFAYTGYFSATVSQNINRETEPVDVLVVLDNFEQIISNDLERNIIKFEIEPWDFNVKTIPMHRSEWSSILFNLYTNAKKAIKRARTEGKVLIEVGIDGDNTFINFHDNGDGIPEANRHRIFNAFFTTSTPASFDAPRDDQMVGTGLGLKIVRDIIISYKGNISLMNPKDGYTTCFRIEIPRSKE
jgi:signal transduction histidine kinase